MFSKKLYSVIWVKRFANGDEIEHLTYVVARSGRAALKLAAKKFNVTGTAEVSVFPNPTNVITEQIA